MPLTGTAPALSATMRAAMLADPDVGAVDGPALTALCDAIATTVLAHIVANAQVLPTALISGAPGAPVTGVGTVL
jgi:hypothetical protein